MHCYSLVSGLVMAASLGIGLQTASAEPAPSSTQTDLEREVEAIERDYEVRLQALEKRLDEQAARAEAPAEPERAPVQSVVANAYTRLTNAFNPDIGVILQGRAAYFSDGNSNRGIPGYLLGGETGRGSEGLALGESELVLSANVDNKLYGFFDVSFDQDEIGIEEGYFSTLSLPLGLRIKGGQFLSSIGYLNARHSHTWDFVDQPLVYESMLSGSLSDAGLQVSWIAPTDLYLELGAEIFRGDAFPANGAAQRGFGTSTVFAKFSGDVGDSHSWASGVSYLRAESNGRNSDAGDGSDLWFDGTSDLFVADVVWKWAPRGNFRARNLTFQAEYMHRHESGKLRAVVDGDTATGNYRGDQDGFYVQGAYQFIPRWRFGVRYGQLFSDNRNRGLPSNVLDRDFSSPRRISAMLDFSNSEFSRFRLQYSHESGGLGRDSLIFFQYIISIGAHGAHQF